MFTEQLAKCMCEKCLIKKALHSINGRKTQGASPALDLPGCHTIVGVSPIFTLQHFPTTKHCSFQWLGSKRVFRCTQLCSSSWANSGRHWWVDPHAPLTATPSSCTRMGSYSGPIQNTRMKVHGTIGPWFVLRRETFLAISSCSTRKWRTPVHQQFLKTQTLMAEVTTKDPSMSLCRL